MLVPVLVLVPVTRSLVSVAELLEEEEEPAAADEADEADMVVGETSVNWLE